MHVSVSKTKNNNQLTSHQASSRGVSSLIVSVGTLYFLLKSFACVDWRRLSGEIVKVTGSMLGSSRRKLRAIGNVFPLPVPADVNESPPFWSATTARSCISRGTCAPSVTSRHMRLAHRHKVRSFSFNPDMYSTGILSS